MGVYIKSMGMPKNCHNCELSIRIEVTYGTVYVCQILNEVIGNVMVRQIHCPLVEVPTPHGDLIDAEKLIEAFKETDCNMRGCYPENLVRMQSPVIRRGD